MYWVKMGGAFAITAGAIASIISKNITPFLATLSMALLFHYLYHHAKKRGMERADYAGTEE